MASQSEQKMSATEEKILVIVRSRPMNELENKKNCKPVLVMSGRSCVISNLDRQVDKKEFIYDRVYSETDTTGKIYTDIVCNITQSVTEGYNGTIFAYGQTSCGKTYTMEGVPEPETQHGIIPRAVQDIFEVMTSHEQFLVFVSCYEIYNENIRDLLDQGNASTLTVASTPNEGFHVKGLSKHPVSDVHQCLQKMTAGLENRATGATQMNSYSSRSHTIFCICAEAQGEDGHIRVGKLNLVDLAGSEKQNKTGVKGSQQKESININLSLHFLGKVISALAEGKKQHIPYRESNLTKLLKDSLGGKSRTLMIACVSPADYNYEETLSTLRFASRTKKVANKPVINEDPKDALLKVYQAEIKELKARLAEGGMGKIDPDLLADIEKKHRMEYESMKMSQEKKMEELQQQIEKQTQRENELKARLATEIGEKRELQADRERAEELRVCLEHDLKEAKLEGERQSQVRGETRASFMNQDCGLEVKSIEPKMIDEDEELARAVQRIAQDDFTSYLKRKESKAWLQRRKKAETTWNCSRCTYVNNPESWRCKMCGSRWSHDQETEKHRDRQKENLKEAPYSWRLPRFFFSWEQTKNKRSKTQSSHTDKKCGCSPRTGESNVNERRLVLFGRTGSGKSTTANNILGETVFDVRSHEMTMTKKSMRRTGSRFGRSIEIVESPSLFDGKMSDADVRLEVGKCVWMTAPGPHTFVLVVPVGCFGQEDQNMVENLIKLFGAGMLKFLIVLFTKKDDVIPDELTLVQYLERVPAKLKELLKSCDNRCVAFNNRGTSDERDADVKEFLDLIDRIFYDNEERVYTNDMWAKAERFMEAKQGQLRRDYEQDVQRKKRQIEREYDKKIGKGRENKNDIINLLQIRIERLEKEEIDKMVDAGTDNPSKQIEDWKLVIKQVEEINDREMKQLMDDCEKKKEDLNQMEVPDFRDLARLEVQNWQNETPGVQEMLNLVSNVLVAVGDMVRRMLLR